MKESETQKLIQSLLKGLSNEDGIENYTRSGKLLSTNGKVTATVAHIAGMFYPWDKKPVYYACKKFFAYISFIDVCSMDKAIKHYNKINSDKIHRFDNIEDLICFCSK